MINVNLSKSAALCLVSVVRVSGSSLRYVLVVAVLCLHTPIRPLGFPIMATSPTIPLFPLLTLPRFPVLRLLTCGIHVYV